MSKNLNSTNFKKKDFLILKENWEEKCVGCKKIRFTFMHKKFWCALFTEDLKEELREGQYDFGKIREMREAILELRLIIDGRWRKIKLTCMTIPIMEKAFDSVECNKQF